MIPAEFQTATLARHPYGDQITSILSATINAVEPGESVFQFVKREQNRLICAGELYLLDQFEHVYLIAFGKAALPMSTALAEILGERLTKGWVVPKHITSANDSRLVVRQGSHPLPDENSLKAGEMLLAAARYFHRKGSGFLSDFRGRVIPGNSSHHGGVPGGLA